GAVRVQGHPVTVAPPVHGLQAPDPDHLPEPVRVAEPADDRRPDPERADADPRHRRVGTGPHRTGIRAAAEGRPARGFVLQIPARIFRWAAPAHRDRTLPDAQAGHIDLRRVGVGTRRVGAGAGAEPAAGPAGRIPPVLYLHF